MPPIKLTSEILAAAITGFEVERDRMQSRIAEILQLLGNPAEATLPSETAKPRKKRSAAVRRRMKIAQQLRWKKIKQGGEPAQAETAKPKRTMSATARKRIAAAQKRRWAIQKAAAQPAATKKAAAGKAAPKKGAAKAAPSAKRPKTAPNKASSRTPKKAVSAPEQGVAQGTSQ
jgi:hypothetical protein